jgi:hypothetical protein
MNAKKSYLNKLVAMIDNPSLGTFQEYPVYKNDGLFASNKENSNHPAANSFHDDKNSNYHQIRKPSMSFAPR